MINSEKFYKNCTIEYNLKELVNMFAPAFKLSEVSMHHPKVQTAEQHESFTV